MRNQEPPRPPQGVDPKAGGRQRLANFLRQYREDILSDWEHALHPRHPEQPPSGALLRDHIPDFLERLADAAEHPREGAAALVSQAVTDEHALERLEQGYEPGEVALEYGLLRHSILQCLRREDYAPSFAELELLDEAIDQGVMRAVSSYAKVRERMLKTLERVSRAALESEDVDTFLPRLLQALMEAAVAVDGTSIMLREGDRLRVRAAVGLGAEKALTDDYSIPIGKGISGTVAADRRTITSRSAATDSRLEYDLIRRLGIRASYSVPLVHRDKLVGVAHMSSRTVFDFSESDKLLFRTLVTRATSFIVQAELAQRERQARAEAQRTLALLDTLLEASPVGIGFLDQELRYLRANETLAKLTGHPVAFLLGKAFREVVPAWVADSFEPLYRRVLETGEPVSNHEFIGRAPDDTGPERHWLGNYYPVRSESGEVMGLGCVVVEITQQKEVEAELRRSGELREQLMGVLGHDLRNPLNAISASAFLLQRTEDLSDGVPARGGAHPQQRGEDGADAQRHPGLRAQQHGRRAAGAPRAGEPARHQPHGAGGAPGDQPGPAAGAGRAGGRLGLVGRGPDGPGDGQPGEQCAATRTPGHAGTRGGARRRPRGAPLRPQRGRAHPSRAAARALPAVPARHHGQGRHPQRGAGALHRPAGGARARRRGDGPLHRERRHHLHGAPAARRPRAREAPDRSARVTPTSAPGPPACPRRCVNAPAPMGIASALLSRRALLVLAGWAVALLLAHHPVLLSGMRLVQGDEGDVRFVHYVLEHGWRHVSGEPAHASFWDPPMFHPEPNTAAYSEVMLGVAPFYWVWRVLGLEADLALQAWVLTLASLNFLAAVWLLTRGLGLRLGPAVVGAILFTAGAPRLNHANHPQLEGQFFVLLAIGAVLMLLRPETDRRRGVAWAGLLVGASVAQLYGGFYWGWFLFFFLLVAGVAALASRALRPRLLAALRTHGPALVLFGVVGLAVLAPLVLHSRQAIQSVGLRSFSEAEGMVPRFWSWFYLGRRAGCTDGRTRSATSSGSPSPGSTSSGWGSSPRWWRGWGCGTRASRPAMRLMLVVTVVTVLLSARYTGGHTPWLLVFKGVPGAAAIRAVARVGVWLLLPAAVGLALFLQRQLTARRTALAVGLGALCLLEQGLSGPTFDRLEARADVSAIVERLRPDCGSFFYAPTAGEFPDFKYQLDATLAAMEAGVPTVNGYSGNAPRGWTLNDNRRFDAAAAARLDTGLESWARSRGLPLESICRIEVPARR